MSKGSIDQNCDLHIGQQLLVVRTGIVWMLNIFCLKTTKGTDHCRKLGLAQESNCQLGSAISMPIPFSQQGKQHSINSSRWRHWISFGKLPGPRLTETGDRHLNLELNHAASSQEICCLIKLIS
jgi:hypothetical protein